MSQDIPDGYRLTQVQENNETVLFKMVDSGRTLTTPLSLPIGVPTKALGKPLGRGYFIFASV